MAKSKHRNTRQMAEPSQKTNHLIAQQSVQFSGPIPAPDTLEAYKQIYPAAVEIIFEHFQKEQIHRHTLEQQQIEANNRAMEANIELARKDQDLFRRSQIFALIIGLAALVCGTTAAIMGSAVAGSIIGGGGVAGLVGAFLYSAKHNQS